MKTIYVIRHAKSGWGDFTQPDFERTLNDRGKRDAPEMARRLKKRGVEIDVFVSSPAKRARSTCEYFCEAYDVKKHDILLIDALYNESANAIYEVIADLSDKYDHVAIFTHNPGITTFANSLTSTVRIDNMPTCGIFAVEAGIRHWSAFRGAEKKFLFFDYPKAAD